MKSKFIFSWPMRAKLMELQREKLIWAAGFYDGEGCCSFAVKRENGRTYRQISLAVSQKADTDGSHETLTRFLEAVQVGMIYPAFSGSKNGKPYGYQYGSKNFEIIQHIICILWPWLSTTKKRQAARSLREYHQHGAGGKLERVARPWQVALR